MTTARRYDLLGPMGLRHGARVDTRTGFLHAPIRPTRTGVLLYRLADGSLSRELKHPEDVFDPASLATLERVVITRGHPRDAKGKPLDVTTKNVAALQKGHAGSKIERERLRDEEHPVIDATVTDDATVKAITEGGLDQVSMGYSVEIVDEAGIWNGQQYDRRHKNIRYDHLAVALPMGGRGGDTVNVLLDDADGGIEERAQQPAPTTEERKDDSTMATIKVRIDEVELDIEPSAWTVLAPIIAKRDQAITTAKAETATATSRIATLEAERDTAKTETAKEKKRADDADAAKGKGGAVKPVLVEMARARKVAALDEATLDAVLAAPEPIPALHKACVLAACADEAAALKDKSAEYFAARFDGLVKLAAKVDSTEPVARELLGAGPKPTGDDLTKQLDEALNFAGDPLAYVDDAGISGRPERPRA